MARLYTYEAQGGSFTDFDKDAVTVTPWGTTELTLLDCNSGDLFMSGLDGDKQLALQRLGEVAGSPCSAAENQADTGSVTGSWYDPATSGQGFSIHKVSAQRGVVYFYGYDDDGVDLWLMGTWEEGVAFGEPMSIPLAQVSGGTFEPFDPEHILREDWGMLELQFEDCISGTAILDGFSGRQELELRLLAGSLGLDCDDPASSAAMP